MILMRHGQSEFNLHFSATKKDPGIEDPRLTPLGQAQAEAAAQSLAQAGIRRIVTSPYTRTMQTAAPLARVLDLPVVITPLVRERFHFACDIGTPRSTLQSSWPQHDFADLEEIWWPEATESAEAVLGRARDFRRLSAGRPDWTHTVVVSHWAFILALSGQSLENGEWIRFDPTADTLA
jgi:broad specificity phosphatase PhoE